jgi:hypothetical protein
MFGGLHGSEGELDGSSELDDEWGEEDGSEESGFGSGSESDDSGGGSLEVQEQAAAGKSTGQSGGKPAAPAATAAAAGDSRGRAKYVAPALRRAQEQAAAAAKGGFGLDPAVERRVTGLLNRCAALDLINPAFPVCFEGFNGQ